MSTTIAVEPGLIGRQRSFVRAIQRAAAQRLQTESDARALLQREQEAAAKARDQALDLADQELARGERILAEAERCAHARTGPGPRVEIVPTAPPSGLSGDPLADMRACVLAQGERLGRMRAATRDAVGGPVSSGMLATGLIALVVGVLISAAAYFGLQGDVARGLSGRGLLVLFALPVWLVLLGLAVWTIAVTPYSPEADHVAMRAGHAHLLYLHQGLVEDAHATFERRVAEREAHYQQAYAHLDKRFRQQVCGLHPERGKLTGQASVVAPEWGDPAWGTWAPAAELVAVTSLGELLPGVHDERLTLPALLAFPDDRSLLFKAAGPARGRAVQAIQSLLLRVLANSPPGRLRFTFVDPIGHSENVASFVHLADHRTGLAPRQAWTEPVHIEQRLGELDRQIRRVSLLLATGNVAALREYNAMAGRLAEPYRILVVLDYPANFSAAAARRLAEIAEHGPRCGVYAVVLVDTEQACLEGGGSHELERAATVIAWDGTRFVWQDEDFKDCLLELDSPPRPPIVERILRATR